MTPREANYIRHSQPLTPKSQASTYVRQVTELFCVRFVQWYANKSRFAGITCIPGNCNSPSRRQVVCVRGTSWGESTGARVGCQITERTNLSAKISGLGKEKFLSAIWCASRAQGSRTSFCRRLPGRTLARRGAGFARVIGLPVVSGRCAPSLSISCRAFAFNKLPSPAADRAGALSVKTEGQLVLRCPQAQGVSVRSTCCGHAFEPSLSPAGIPADQYILRPPTMVVHGRASPVRRVTARRSTRVVRTGPGERAGLSVGDSWGAGDGRLHARQFGCDASAASTEYPRGVRYSSQGSLRRGRRHFGADDQSPAALSARLVFFSNGGRVAGDCSAISCGVNRITVGRQAPYKLNAVLETGVTAGETDSDTCERAAAESGATARRDGIQFSSGDGLGNHQPGSNTWGLALRPQPPSGRARNRAICPAVAQFNEGRAA